MHERVSACVITHNEEDKIERCLQSIEWCDEIIVVDSFSDDRTVEICKRYTDRVYQHEWLGYIGQRNLIREMADCPWVLFLDADEEVSPKLREEIQLEFSKRTEDVVGYSFPRQVHYLGKWIRHGEWYPDIKLRLFKKNQGYSVGQEPHDQVQVNGSVQQLKSPLWHYTYDDIYDHLLTMNRFSGISAESKFNTGSSFRWTDFIFRPMWRFFKGFVIKGGMLDGRRGFLIASICSFGVAMKYAKLWEMELQAEHKLDDKQSRP